MDGHALYRSDNFSNLKGGADEKKFSLSGPFIRI